MTACSTKLHHDICKLCATTTVGIPESHFEAQWNAGIFWCQHSNKGVGQWITPDDDPPQHCRFALEQTMHKEQP